MRFELTSAEGLPIRGTFDVPTDPRALVVIVHGFKGFMDWGFFPFLAETLCNDGFAVCRFNMSRSGIGANLETFDRLDLFEGDTYSKQLADLRRVVAWAHEQFAFLPIFLFGHSRGGGIAFLGAHDVPHLRGIVTWSAIARADRWDEGTKKEWRAGGYLEVINARTKQTMRLSAEILDDYERNRESLDITRAVSRLRCPMLLLHGGADESVPIADLHEIASCAPSASTIVIARASHTYNAIHPLIHVPFALSMAATLTSRFIAAYTETRTIVGTSVSQQT